MLMQATSPAIYFLPKGRNPRKQLPLSLCESCRNCNITCKWVSDKKLIFREAIGRDDNWSNGVRLKEPRTLYIVTQCDGYVADEAEDAK